MLTKSRIAASLAVIALLAVVIAGFMYLRTPARKKATRAERGIHQSMVIFAQNENTYVPGTQPAPATTQPTPKPAPSNQTPATQPATSSNAQWKGNITWDSGKNIPFNPENARIGHLSLNTKHGSTINSDDFLFTTATTQPSTQPATASALIGYTSSDF